MQNPEEEAYHHHHRHPSDTEVVGGGGPSNKRGGSKMSTGLFILPEDTPDINCVEVTLDVLDDSVAAVHSPRTAGDGDGAAAEEEDARGMKKKSSSMARNASSRIRQVSHELKRLATLTGRRQQPRRRLDRTKSVAANALVGLKFISSTTDQGGGGGDWAGVERRFDRLTSKTQGLLHRSLFGVCIGMYKECEEHKEKKECEKFAEELFDALARRRCMTGESITKAELKEFWEQIADQSFDSRLHTFFDMVDKDGNGRITEDEVREIISLSASENKLSNIKNQAGEYARLIMEELDPDEVGYIMLENLKTLLLEGPGQGDMRAGGESRQLSKLLSQKLKATQEDTNVVRRLCIDFRYFLSDNWKRVWVMGLWVGVMAALFAYRYIEYKNKKDVFGVMGHCVCMAKGAAETLKLNMALILLPVCRNTITWLRNRTALGVAVPFDDNLNFHKLIAVAIAIGVGIHGISHLACDFPRILNAGPEEYEPMKRYFGDQPTSYWYFVKGYEGVTGIIMVVLMAIAFTLASPWFRMSAKNLPKTLKKLTGFNAFWYSHHLFVIVYALLIVHGIKLYLTHKWYKKTTWMYIAVPIVLYASERLIRALRSSVKDVKILKVAVYPGNVLTLHMSKHQDFKYKSGQYIFVNCAAVSPFEWHPFSITSAPGDDYVSVHIRTLGDWTRQLKKVFSDACQPSSPGKSGLLRAECSQGETNPNLPRVLIDGPYGAPTQDYKDYEVVLLVGLGIGATPMISVVKDIVNNIKAIDDEEKTVEEGIVDGDIGYSPHSSTPKQKTSGSSGSTTRHNFKTRRAYFYWMTREQGSFDWFKGALNEVAKMDRNRVIEMHNHCTSVYEEGDVRSALISMLQSINHANNGVDVVSGTRVKSHFAKPNWRNVYKQIALNHPGARVGVFYCGNPMPVKELRYLASDFSHKTSTKFEFHKENF